MTGGAAARVVRPGHLLAGRYRLVSRLGSGAMGTVWCAQDQLLGREVAVKQVFSTAGMSDADAGLRRERVLREGRAAARLSHPNAVAMYDVAVEDGEPWLVMEHLPSVSLAAAVTRQGPLPADRVARIGAQVAAALAGAHAAGVLHRDVKPGNVLLAATDSDTAAATAGRTTVRRTEGVVKLADFGIARTVDEAASPVQAAEETLTGTPAYFAPEVARGQEPTAASDVYSLGSTLFTAVEGAPPFGLDVDTRALLARVATGDITHPRRAGALTPLLLRMLEPDPARRPTMDQVRDDLTDLASGSPGPGQVRVTPRTPPRSRPWWRRWA